MEILLYFAAAYKLNVNPGFLMLIMQLLIKHFIIPYIGKLLKVTILLDTRNSKKSKRILFIALDCCPKACVLYLLLQFNFVTVANRA